MEAPSSGVASSDAGYYAHPAGHVERPWPASSDAVSDLTRRATFRESPSTDSAYRQSFRSSAPCGPKTGRGGRNQRESPRIDRDTFGARPRLQSGALPHHERVAIQKPVPEPPPTAVREPGRQGLDLLHVRSSALRARRLRAAVEPELEAPVVLARPHHELDDPRVGVLVLPVSAEEVVVRGHLAAELLVDVVLRYVVLDLQHVHVDLPTVQAARLTQAPDHLVAVLAQPSLPLLAERIKVLLEGAQQGETEALDGNALRPLAHHREPAAELLVHRDPELLGAGSLRQLDALAHAIR